MNIKFRLERTLDDIDLQELDGAPHAGDRQIQFATFRQGEYMESIVVTRSRAAEIHSRLGEILGKTSPTKDVFESQSLSNRKIATVLAALRYWQREGLMSAGYEQDIADDGGSLQPLSATEIDALCEEINCPPIRHGWPRCLGRIAVLVKWIRRCY